LKTSPLRRSKDNKTLPQDYKDKPVPIVVRNESVDFTNILPNNNNACLQIVHPSTGVKLLQKADQVQRQDSLAVAELK
jgi:hypothetical protein